MNIFFKEIMLKVNVIFYKTKNYYIVNLFSLIVFELKTLGKSKLLWRYKSLLISYLYSMFHKIALNIYS